MIAAFSPIVATGNSCPNCFLRLVGAAVLGVNKCFDASLQSVDTLNFKSFSQCE